jgi:hypothetical protein
MQDEPADEDEDEDDADFDPDAPAKPKAKATDKDVDALADKAADLKVTESKDVSPSCLSSPPRARRLSLSPRSDFASGSSKCRGGKPRSVTIVFCMVSIVTGICPSYESMRARGRHTSGSVNGRAGMNIQRGGMHRERHERGE